MRGQQGDVEMWCATMCVGTDQRQGRWWQHGTLKVTSGNTSGRLLGLFACANTAADDVCSPKAAAAAAMAPASLLSAR